ncbi:MAG: Ldh family oxidoreductase [Bacteroidota bacterium]|nr:Ldh family oxidoreductase [Bacteroidota bacterium]
MTEHKAINIKYQQVYRLVVDLWQSLGFPVDVAEIATTNLLLADLRGISSHGIARLPGYIKLIKANRINPAAKPKIVHETMGTARLDGDAGLGLYVGHIAQEIARAKASIAGSGWVSVYNSSHFGIGAAHTLPGVPHKMISLSMTNASPLVAPIGSIEAYFGTNPISVAIPGGKYPPFILDMATSAAANGKLEIAAREGKNIPKGWALDSQGNDSNQADVLKNDGVLLPLGSTDDLGIQKGSGLAGWVDIMSALLSGANYGKWVPPFVAFKPIADSLPGLGIGHFIGSWLIEAFIPYSEFELNIEKWIEGLKSLKPKDNDKEVLVPGEPEHKAMMNNVIHGIDYDTNVWDDFEQLCKLVHK